MTRREERQEGEVHEENDGLRAQTTPGHGQHCLWSLGRRVARSSSAAGQCGAVGGPGSFGGSGGGDGRRCCCVLPPVKEQAEVAELEAQVAAAEDPGFWSSFSKTGRRGKGSVVRPGPRSPTSLTVLFRLGVTLPFTLCSLLSCTGQ